MTYRIAREWDGTFALVRHLESASEVEQGLNVARHNLARALDALAQANQAKVKAARALDAANAAVAGLADDATKAWDREAFDRRAYAMVCVPRPVLLRLRRAQAKYVEALATAHLMVKDWAEAARGVDRAKRAAGLLPLKQHVNRKNAGAYGLAGGV